ncbi:hypothetical protein H4S14_000661 [Agrobacterium vitis]|nr:hypothetical protein [Agrobacterium vitis]MBE1436934.1 hypothetical protein [Agrobacterium vitis]
MKLILAAAVIAAFLPSVSFADTLLFPSDAPVAQITIPADWEPKETESGIDATSADEAIYLAVDVATARTSDKVIDEAIAFLEKNGVKIDGSTQKQTDEVINGMDMTNFDWTGTDDDGAVNVSLSVVSPKPGKLLIITYWGTKGKQERHFSELQEIIGSLKPAN